MNAMWTKERITRLLDTSDKAVERAIVTIYDRGFRYNHTQKGSYYAQWVLSGQQLTGYHLSNARKIALHYTGQLADVANVKSDNACKGTKRDAPNSARMIRIMQNENDRARPPVKSDVDVSVTGVSYASTARMLVEAGLMTGDEADEWKDGMKDGTL